MATKEAHGRRNLQEYCIRMDAGFTALFTCTPIPLLLTRAGGLRRTVSPLCLQGFSMVWKISRDCKCGLIFSGVVFPQSGSESYPELQHHSRYIVFIVAVLLTPPQPCAMP